MGARGRRRTGECCRMRIDGAVYVAKCLNLRRCLLSSLRVDFEDRVCAVLVGGMARWWSQLRRSPVGSMVFLATEIVPSGTDLGLVVPDTV